MTDASSERNRQFIEQIRKEAAECEHDFRPRYGAHHAGAIEYICIDCGTVREDEP
jgi:hypothetical protein